MEKEYSQNRAIPNSLKCISGRGIEQRHRLLIGKRRGFPFVRAFAWALDAVHWMGEDGITGAEIIVKIRKGREFAANRCRREHAGLKRFAPGDHMRPRDGSKFLRPLHANKPHERSNII